MNDDYKKLELFTRRAFLLGLGKLSLTTILLGKLSYLQIIKRDQYTSQSENNRSKIIWLKPLRGKILDRYNIIVADNAIDFKLYLDREELSNNGKELEKTLIDIYQILELGNANIAALYKKIKKLPNVPPIQILDKLNWDQVVKLEYNSYKIPGAYVDFEYIRHYTSSSCSNFLGYTGGLPESEITKTPFNSIVRIGKNGIEQKFDETLKGTIGIKEVEVNARGVIKSEISLKADIPGEDLKLSIDLELQDKAAKILANQSGAAVVMNVDTGEILAMVSTPGFSSNDLVKGLSSEEWQELTGNSKLPLTNKAVSLTYPPGSVFKPIVALAALESGISPDEHFYCSGYFQFGNRKFGCWNKNGHGSVNMYRGIIQSCNCYFYQLALKIGIDPIKNCATMLGLGEKPFTELPNVQSGIMPDRDWKLAKYHSKWTLSDTINCSIGQGYITTSPMQICLMLSRIINGRQTVPTLLFGGNTNREFEKLKISDKSLDIVRAALTGVVNDPSGLGYRHRVNELTLGGKTGTAQVISKKSFSQDLSHVNTPWEFKNHGLFMGFTEDNAQKRICCAVIIEHIGSGAATIPFAKEILLAANNK